MTRAAWRVGLLLSLLVSTPVAAQPRPTEVSSKQRHAPRPTRASTKRDLSAPLRINAGVGLGLTLGPRVTVGGRSAPDSPDDAQGMLLLGIDFPLASVFSLGVHGDLLVWSTPIDTRLGDVAHGTLDLGVSPRFRRVTGNHRIDELFVTVPMGISLLLGSRTLAGPPGYAYETEGATGFHVGILAGYELSWVSRVIGWVFEGGFIYRRIATEATYSNALVIGREAVVYQPMSLLVRVGIVFRL